MSPTTQRAEPKRHTLVVQLHDRPGALYRAIGLIRRRDYNVSSLVVGASERPGTSRMVLVIEAADVHQVVQQLSRLVDVLSVAEIARNEELVRETVLAVVKTTLDDGDALHAAAAAAGARVSHQGESRVLLEMTAEPSAVDAFVMSMRQFDLRQLARTGPIVIQEMPQLHSSHSSIPSLNYTAPSAQESVQ
jgi:acetolactate synthase-1/3 small subunit